MNKKNQTPTATEKESSLTPIVTAMTLRTRSAGSSEINFLKMADATKGLYIMSVM